QFVYINETIIAIMSTNKNPAILHTNQQEQQYNNQLFHQQHAFMQRSVEGVGYQISPHTYQPPAGTQPMPLQPNPIRSNPQQQQPPQQDVKMQHPLTQHNVHNATHRYNMSNQSYRSSQQQPQMQAQFIAGVPTTAFYAIQNRPFLNQALQSNPSNLVPTATPPPLQQPIISQMPGPAVPINQSKNRSRAVKIINPDTKEEVKVGNDELAATSNDESKLIHMEKHYETETSYMTEYNPYVDAQTPVVSAMSDGPSVEISHKQKVKKKVIEVVEDRQQVPIERVDDEFNGTVAASVLQTSAVEFQPSKPPPMVIQPREQIQKEEIMNVAPVDETLTNQNHIEELPVDYVSAGMAGQEIEHIEPELESQAEPVIPSSTDETDKSVDVMVSEEIEYNTEMAPDAKLASTPNVDEITEGIEDMSYDSISSEDNISKDKIDEPQAQPEPKANPMAVIANQRINSLANTGFGNAIMEELKTAQQSAQLAQQATQQSAQQQQLDVPIKRAASKSQTLLQYEQGQWSPSNADGKKFYNRDQMLALRTHPAAQTEPASLLSAIRAPPKYTQQPVSGYNKQVQRQGSGFGKRPSQNSQQSAMGNPNKNSKCGMIHVSLSLNEDVKLNETENAWKPSFISKDANDTASNDVLYKRVRGILNKLTPEKFDTLLEQIKSFNIDTAERLNGVIELVFEKAIDEPNFSVAYAQLCHKLSEKCFVVDADAKQAKFKKTLITKCQNEFQNHVIVEEAKVAEKLQPFIQKIEETTDPDRKAECQANYEEEERKLRRRSVGTVRFIGELFKMGMLTSNIMMNCVSSLLDRNSEDKLECLCKLLTTIGAKLEDKKNAASLAEYFKQMREIVEKKNQNTKISSRVRFMIQDVIDLRKNNWVPRRETANPKKMGQIQKEADAEQSNRGGMANEDGWMTPSTKSRSLIDPSKIKLKSIDDSTTLGAAAQFKWSGSSNTQPATTQTTNSFSILEGTRSGSMGGNKDIYSKGSMERDRYDSRGGNASRSGSQHSSRESSAARSSYSMKPMPSRVASQSMTMMPSVTRPSERPQQQPVVQRERDEPDEERTNRIKVIANELLLYHNRGEIKLESCHLDADIEPEPEKYRWAIVREMYNACVDMHQLRSADRVFAGQAISSWINRKLITIDDNLRALKEFLEPALDLVCDIPMLWVYVAEFITPIIKNNSLSLIQIRSVCPEEYAMEQLLQNLIPYATTEHGPQFVRNLFKECKWSDLMSERNVPQFISKNKFEFVNDSTVSVQRTSTAATNIDLIQQRVKEFLREGADIEHIQEFITVNLAQVDKEFIRALSTVVAEIIMEDMQHKSAEKKHTVAVLLLSKYIDENEEMQLQCLNAILLLMIKLEHPKDALRTIFSRLYDDYVVSKNVFEMWRDSKEMLEGKGVVAKNLFRFFDLLKKDGSSGEEDNN
ncbi:Eukaryotic translation initiation factor 4 gamma 3, partial [Pseudolycoriella hygida]